MSQHVMSQYITIQHMLTTGQAALRSAVLTAVLLPVVALAQSDVGNGEGEARPYDAISAGRDAFNRAEEQRQNAVRQQVQINDNTRFWGGVPTSRGEVLYYNHVSPIYGPGQLYSTSGNRYGSYGYGTYGAGYSGGYSASSYGPMYGTGSGGSIYRSASGSSYRSGYGLGYGGGYGGSYRSAYGLSCAYGPGYGSYVEQTYVAPVVGYRSYLSPADPDAAFYSNPVRQPIGQRQVQTGPNRWESHPVYVPEVPDSEPLPPVSSPWLDRTPYATRKPATAPPLPAPAPAPRPARGREF